MNLVRFNYRNYIIYRNIMARVFSTNVHDFKKDVLEAEVPVLLELSTNYCDHCLILKPFIDSLEERYKDRDLDVVKLNVYVPEQQKNVDKITQKYKLRGVPTVYLIKNGEVVEEKIGPSAFEVASMIQRNT
ncbi:MAG: Thioredoxin C-2 [Acinetobacter bereziniae]|uniref:Thioredoxin C-2 n=1 Tax=Acinetobacter bereziniae TaxID=106648 RepID=A0A833PF52_ACIBZ|nr:MAG: Thioredoxin C-2 [Acinetobacter bereziniae]